MADLRRLAPLDRAESLKLLGSVSLGRVVYTHLALPAIRPVSHLVETDQVVIRAEASAPIAALGDGQHATVVAYEADAVDPDGRLAWSATIIGRARRVIDPQEVERYRRALPGWASDSHDDEFIAIQADMVDGFRLVREGGGSLS